MIKIGIILTSSLYLFHFLFFWLFESTDSYFYWAFANFIKTGSYYAPPPYNYSVPSTMEPPLYSMILFLLQLFPRADILIHLIQIMAILGAAAMIYYISRLAALIFLLVPGHFVYMSNLVAEPIAVFFISLYLYLLKRGSLKYLLIMGAVMTLQRYNLIIFYALSIFMFTISKIKIQKDFIALVVSGLILASWVFINHHLNGSWGLSNSEGKHLYNRILHFDRLLPAENDPKFIEFKKIVGEGIDYFKPWWFYEPQLVGALGSETESSRLMGDVAIAALLKNPLTYLLNTPKFFLFAHSENPTFHDDLYLWEKGMQKNCRNLGRIEFCRPLIPSNISFKIWDGITKMVDNFYLYYTRFVNYFLLFPSIIFALLQKDKFIKSVAFLYLSSILFFILFEAPLPRYTYIFTPLQVLLVVRATNLFLTK